MICRFEPLSQTAVDPFHFTYLYWIVVPAGREIVPVHGTFAPLPWIVNAKPLAGAQLPSCVMLPTTYRFWPTTVFAFEIVNVTDTVPEPPLLIVYVAEPTALLL